MRHRKSHIIDMIYFLFGEDTFRSKQKLQEIVDRYKKVHKSGLNLIYSNAKNQDFKDFLNNFRTTSMFAEKKLVILKDIFPNSKFCEDFLENLKNLEKVEDIIVAYEEGSADQRKKIFKELQKHAKCQEFKPLQPAQLRKWVADSFSLSGAKIDLQAQTMLLSFVGDNLWQMANEIKKLSNYKKGQIITEQDVELLCKPNIENDIFKTIDALASKNKNQALNLIHKHIEKGDNCLYLLSMIAFQFRNLLIIKDLQKKQRPLSNSGLHPFVVKKSSYLCNKFSFEELKKIYQKIFQVDCNIKTGKIEAELALDMLVAEI